MNLELTPEQVESVVIEELLDVLQEFANSHSSEITDACSVLLDYYLQDEHDQQIPLPFMYGNLQDIQDYQVIATENGYRVSL